MWEEGDPTITEEGFIVPGAVTTSDSSGNPFTTNLMSIDKQKTLVDNSITAPWVNPDHSKFDYGAPPGSVWGPGPGAGTGLTGGSDPVNIYSENNGTRSNNEEEPEVEAVTLTGSTFNPTDAGWQLPTTTPYVPYTPPAAQDWSAWILGSPFGGEGGLAYQPGSREYLTRFIPENVWGSRPGVSEGVLAELAPSTWGLLSEEALPRATTSAFGGQRTRGNIDSSQHQSSRSSDGSRKGSGPFLWKPVSESDGNLVILANSSYGSDDASLVDSEGNVVEKGRYVGRTNNNRPTYRFSKPGGAYPTNLRIKFGNKMFPTRGSGDTYVSAT
jgi:hypothetical protein